MTNDILIDTAEFSKCLIDTAELSKRLNINVWGIRKLCRLRKIPFRKLYNENSHYYFYWPDIIKWLEEKGQYGNKTETKKHQCNILSTTCKP